MRWSLPRSWIIVQLALAAAAMVVLAMWPPASGELLLVPIGGGDINAVARVALAGGAALLGAGPLPGSLVVVGDRARIARQQGSLGIVIMAAPPAGCGTPDVAERVA